MPEPIAIQPMQWTRLADLSDVPPLDDSDQACMDELRQVLVRHGKIERFALHLAHGHFALADDELLIERPDPDGRSHHVTVGRLGEAADARPTTWVFSADPTRLAATVQCICVNPANAAGCAYHSTPAAERQKQEDKAILDRRLAEEKARYEKGMPVAGHQPDRSRDPGRER